MSKTEQELATEKAALAAKGGEGGQPPVAPNPLDAKLEGTDIPEKFRGKTVKEVMSLMGQTEGALTQAQQEISQWHAYFKSKETAAGSAEPKEKRFDPLEHLDEDQAKAVLALTDVQLAPLIEGTSALLKEATRALKPDFDKYEKRAEEVYKEFPPAYKLHPKFGWDLAYRLAKSEDPEVMGVKPAAPPLMGPSQTGGVPPIPEKLSEEQATIARKMGLTESEYIKYKSMVDPTKFKKEEFK